MSVTSVPLYNSIYQENYSVPIEVVYNSGLSSPKALEIILTIKPATGNPIEILPQFLMGLSENATAAATGDILTIQSFQVNDFGGPAHLHNSPFYIRRHTAASAPTPIYPNVTESVQDTHWSLNTLGSINITNHFSFIIRYMPEFLYLSGTASWNYASHYTHLTTLRIINLDSPDNPILIDIEGTVQLNLDGNQQIISSIDGVSLGLTAKISGAITENIYANKIRP